MAKRIYRTTTRALLLLMMWLGLCLSTWNVLDGGLFFIWAVVVGLAMLATFPRPA